MIDRTHSGYRCSVIHPLRTVQGDLPRGCHGTVVYETDNLDRHLILMNWDNGIVVPVFPEEITVESEPAGAGH
jgi:hypothetical protein